MLWSFILALCFSSQVIAHSWMSCPRSFNQYRFRGGTLKAPCEAWYMGATNHVKAGDRLKVGWTSNNHGGGYVRIALIEATSATQSNYFGATEAAFQQSVIKFGCYGHDTRKDRTKNGDCFHPCNARPGCEFQSDIKDVERFDTTITVPTNLDDGIYVLQTAMLVGNSKRPYYSCAKLSVTGGDSSLDCRSDDDPPKYKCHRAAGSKLEALSAGTKRGEFCFHKDRRGEVDDRIAEKPINIDCDPRIFCGLSTNPTVCYEETGMANLDAAINDPKQLHCATHERTATCTDGIKNQGELGIDCGGPCAKKCSTCSDGIQNQGEDGIDCGGPCAACSGCSDGKKNNGELGVDCGGPCKKCGNCANGIKDIGETGIDCGGSCAACPTCTDGIHNQGENGVDCGGPCCNTCLPTCTDKIKNHGEEGVDCGGPCKACVKVQSGDYINIRHVEKDWGNGPVRITIGIEFLKDIQSNWKLILEYNQEIKIDSCWGAASVLKKSGTIIKFAKNSWIPLPKAGQTQEIKMMVSKTTDQTLEPTGHFFEVGSVNDVGKRSLLAQDPTKRVKCGGRTCGMNEGCVRIDILPCRDNTCKVTRYCSKSK